MTTFEKAFIDFLKRIKRGKMQKIQFYQFHRNSRVAYFSYVGYDTTQAGIHGIHYCGKTGNYFFGSVNPRFGLETLFRLNDSQISKIPNVIRDSFKKNAKVRGSRYITTDREFNSKISDALRGASRRKMADLIRGIED